MPNQKQVPKHIRDKFKVFEKIGKDQRSLTDIIKDCLVVIQDEVPQIDEADELIPGIVISALYSVGVWPNGLKRDDILKKGFINWASPDFSKPLSETWTAEPQPGRGKVFGLQPIFQSAGLHQNQSFDLVQPRDGPSEIWSISSVRSLFGRRAVLSYVHNKQAEDDVKWRSTDHGRRRGVRLSVAEAEKIKAPTFLKTHSSAGLDDIWHDGMRYASPDGKWNRYAGIIPYLLPGSAIWHSIPLIRSGGVNST